MEFLVGVSAGMAARIGFAAASALLLGAWAWSRSKGQNGEDGRLAAALRVLVLGLCGFWSAAWLAIALIRLSYPYELEWCSGAMRDMAARALHGQPLYVAPGPGWFPYEYPPLYLWASALLMRLTGGEPSFVPMRIVSILSTIGSAWILFAWVNRLVAPAAADDDRPAVAGRGFWGPVAAGLFLASYRFTGAWYDIERIDMLFLFLSLLGVLLLQRSVDRDSLAWSAASALAFSLAFLTKQQAILFILGGVAALAWERKWRLLGVYALACAALCGASVAMLNSATDGWFGYYCFRVPLANGIKLNLVRVYLLNDLPLFAPTLAIFVLSWRFRRRIENEQSPLDDPPTPDTRHPTPAAFSVLPAMTAMGLLGSLLSRAHWGGDQNVLITGYVFLGAAACAIAGRWSAANPGVRSPLYALALAQLLTLSYRPGAQIPSAANRAVGERYAALIRSLEREGPILSLDHGSFTATPRFHLMGLLDVMNTEKGLPAPLLATVRSHYYAAIVMDARPETEGFLGEFAQSYHRIENADISTSWIVTGFPTPSPGRSVWILRP